MAVPCLFLDINNNCGKTRLKATRNVSAGEIADVLRMWIASRGNLNLAELLQVPPQWLYARKMPKAADLLKFQDIAFMFVHVAPSLKLGQTNCYDAMLQVEKHDTVQTHNKKSLHKNSSP